MPTFLILKQSRETTRIQRANGKQLQEAVKELAAEAETFDSTNGDASASSSSGGSVWLGAILPRGY